MIPKYNAKRVGLEGKLRISNTLPKVKADEIVEKCRILLNNLCVLSKAEHTILHGSNPEQLYELYPKRRKRIKTLIDAL